MTDTSTADDGGLDLNLKAFVHLTDAVTDMKNYFANWVQQEWDYENGLVDVNVGGSGAPPATTQDIVIDCGGPPYGKFWEVRQLAIAGTNPTGTSAGTAFVFDQAIAPISQVLSGLNFVDIFASVPLGHFYSTRQFAIHAPSKLWVVVHTPTAATTYVVNGTAVEAPDVRYRMRGEL